MSIEKIDFDSINENDLQELIDAQVPEGLRLEYKLKIYGKSDSDKRELLKDVSAFANSHGGHLIIGIEEAEGAASALVGVEIDADAEILRMEQIIRNAIEPPIPGVRTRAIPLLNGNKIILMRIPRSWNPPHRVTAQGINKFFARHSAGVHEPSVEELRSLFNQSASAIERARQFRDIRIRTVTEGEGPRPLVNNGRLFLHIVPTAAFSGMVNIDVEAIHKKNYAFRPLGASGMSPRFNFHGFVNERGGDQNHGYTQVFRNGALEAVKADIVTEHTGERNVAGLYLETKIFERLSSYINGLKDLGVPPPIIIMFTFEGVESARYSVSRSFFSDDESLPVDYLPLPECVLEDYGEEVEYHRAVRPAFDALWNAVGYSKCLFFDEDGRWVGEQR